MRKKIHEGSVQMTKSNITVIIVFLAVVCIFCVDSGDIE